ncbi:MAG: CDP-alcohol phosphatidyltransferase family protein [bacterium]|nr:CDP-alcohol phosphatidyltransferase family protein [bacterium]
MAILDIVRNLMRKFMHGVAVALNKATDGKLHPDIITYFGLAMHLPIAGLIMIGDFVSAGILLIIFGLFDTLDGELARLQKRASPAGMVLDASTDRIKEVFLYIAIAYYFVDIHEPDFAVWAVAALGASLLVSYIKAKGETAIADKKLSSNEKNRVFSDGVLRFEVRMFLIVVGLFFDKLEYILYIIAVLAALTAVGRLYRIVKALRK